ncbi:MAG: DNA methyltransferase [Candidatus Eremiobacterota bacterium]
MQQQLLYNPEPPARARRSSPSNSFSDLDLENWRDYDDIITESLWLLGSRDRSGPHCGDYHGNFVPQIAQQVIKRFTKTGEVVVDLFSGMGTTMIECKRLGRYGIGVELQEAVNRNAGTRIDDASGPEGTQVDLITGDSRTEATAKEIVSRLNSWGFTMCHHVVLHPPYWDIIRFTGGEDAADLSNAPTEEDFYGQFRQVVQRAWTLLHPGRFMTLVIGDKYSNSEWVPLGFECMNVCREVGFRLKAINVKDIQGNEKGKGKNSNLWKYRALRHGLYIFKHEYVMIFKKPAE